MKTLRSFRCWLRRLEPRVLAGMNGPLLGRLRPWLDGKDVLSFHRNPLALGVAIGMFCGLIPGPLQIACSLLLCVWLRANVIAAAVATIYTNPLTIVPLYMLAFKIGQLVLPQSTTDATDATAPLMGGIWSQGVLEGLTSLGTPLLVGLPIMGLIFAVSSYLLVQLICLLPVIQRFRHLKKKSTLART